MAEPSRNPTGHSSETISCSVMTRGMIGQQNAHRSFFMIIINSDHPFGMGIRYLSNGHKGWKMKATLLTIVGILLTIIPPSYAGPAFQSESFHGAPFIGKGPRALLPDSLGGKDLKGYVALGLRIDTSGVIHSFKVMRFWARDSISNRAIDYRGGAHDSSAVYRYHSWLRSYVNQVVLKRNPRHFGFWERFFKNYVKDGNTSETLMIRFGG